MRKRVALGVAIGLLVCLVALATIQGVALANANRQHRSAIRELQAKLGAAETQVESLSGELEDYEGRLADATAALQQADSNVQRLRRVYDRLYRDYERLATLAAIVAGTTYTPTFDSIHCTTSTLGYYTYTDCY